MRIALTADLHWGQNPRGDQATLGLHRFLRSESIDLLLLGGDNGTSEHFAECLELFADLPCAKAAIPGNHDLWVADQDPRGDSLQVYQQYLPSLCTQFNYHYLDHGPLLFPDAGLGIVGSINWYDYSWSLERLKQEVPKWEWHLQNKAFTRGRHNDGKFIRWPLDDVRFTAEVVQTLEQHLDQALAQVDRVLVMTHHPAFYGLSFPRDHPPVGLDSLLWDALSGNQALEAILQKHAERIPLVFSGHTHRARENMLGPIRGYNIGGDYHFKRLLLLDWPRCELRAIGFGQE